MGAFKTQLVLKLHLFHAQLQQKTQLSLSSRGHRNGTQEIYELPELKHSCKKGRNGLWWVLYGSRKGKQMTLRDLSGNTLRNWLCAWCWEHKKTSHHPCGTLCHCGASTQARQAPAPSVYRADEGECKSLPEQGVKKGDKIEYKP